jgi:hypothetical protein
VDCEVSSNSVTDDLLIAVVGGSANWISYPGLVVSKSDFVVAELFIPSIGSKVCIHSVDEGGAVEINSPVVVLGNGSMGKAIGGEFNGMEAVVFPSIVGDETPCLGLVI